MKHKSHTLFAFLLLTFVLLSSSPRPFFDRDFSGRGGGQVIELRVLLDHFAIPGEMRMRPMWFYEEGRFIRPHGEGVVDPITLKLYNSPADPRPVYQEEVLLQEDGLAYWSLPADVRGTYYLGLRHKMHEQVYSALPLELNGSGKLSYDFSSSSSRTYGGLAVALHDEASTGMSLYAVPALDRRNGNPPLPPEGFATLTIHFMLQGYYNHNQPDNNDPLIQAHEDKGSGVIAPKYPMPRSDMVTIRLHSEADYGEVLFTYETNLYTTGHAKIQVPTDLDEPVWLSVMHRNHLETVYKDPLDFTTFFPENSEIHFSRNASGENVNNAYGGNQALLSGGVDGYYGIYGGDINQDGNININDAGPINAGIVSGAQGYLVTDITGDGLININDAGPVNASITAGRARVIP